LRTECTGFAMHAQREFMAAGHNSTVLWMIAGPCGSSPSFV
jgi:hypothetical protein